MTSSSIIPGSTYDPYTSGWYLLPVEPAKVQVNTAIGLTTGIVSVLNAHTLQGLIELVYVRVGNDVLWRGMDGLDNALEQTTNTLQILTAVQELHNALVTSSLGSFSAWFRFSQGYSSHGRYQSNYNSVASAFFGVPIIPDFIFSSAHAEIKAGNTTQSYQDFAQQLANVRDQLSGQVQILSGLATQDDLDNPNSLYRTSKQVLDDLPPEHSGLSGAAIAWSDAKLWAMDYYGAYNGQDLAQVNPTHVVVTYFGSIIPKVWQGVSISPGRQIGMGTGYRGDKADGYTLFGNPNVKSVQLVTHGGTMPGQVGAMESVTGTMVITFSGRMAIAFNSWQSNVDNQSSGIPATIVMINPIDASGDVQNPIVGDYAATGNSVDDNYIGSFGGVTRGQAQNAGSFQQNITLAMTAAQGLNNTQTEQVRGFLFTFEEYYKSASSILTSLTQLIQKYAQGIRPA